MFIIIASQSDCLKKIKDLLTYFITKQTVSAIKIKFVSFYV